MRISTMLFSLATLFGSLGGMLYLKGTAEKLSDMVFIGGFMLTFGLLLIISAKSARGTGR